MVSPVHASELPQFSFEERQRRWQRVRHAMAREGMDLLLAPTHTGHWGQLQADVRYLTQLAPNMYEVFAVFPLEGEVVAITRMDSHTEWLRNAYEWVGDVRGLGRRTWSALVIERMHELGVTEQCTQRVGVVGLAQWQPRSPEGIIRYDTMARLKEAFPRIDWVNATGLMNHARAVKSPEEIACLERAGQIADKGVEAMIEHARPGMPAQTLWAHMQAAMLLAGGEYPSMINWDMRPDLSAFARHPTYRLLEKDDFSINEIEGKFNGYNHHTLHPAYLGQAPENYHRAYDAAYEAFEAAQAVARPGNTTANMAQAVEVVFQRHGLQGQFMMLGRGLGEDGPHQTMPTPDGEKPTKLEEGHVFAIRPVTGDVGASGRRFRMWLGDTCVVTPTGARRLSQHKMELAEIPC
ncbi:MAG: M24 family metallopeptidase [Chloroflexi bacterium]|nr:M24 family metallopeptidase [Chloroflexota bacterium]